MTHEEFRSRLDEITALEFATLWSPRIAALKDQYPHSIKDRGYPAEKGVTCFAYALNLGDSPIYITIARDSDPNVWADASFIQYLTERRTLKRCARECEGDVAIYYLGGEPKHAASVIGAGVLRSKWGSGPVYEHESSDVPAGYGQPSYFRALSADESLEAFFHFCGTRGIDPARYT